MLTAQLHRALHPLTARHHAAALTSLACEYALWPLHVVCATIGAYAQAHRDVLRIVE